MPEFTVAEPEAYRPQYHPRLAWSPAARLWLVVWQDGSLTEDGSTPERRSQDILAARIDADGRVLDPAPILVARTGGAQQRPAVASDGNDFLIVWHDLRNGKDWDLYAARVRASGEVLDKNGKLLVGGDRNQCFPDVVHGNGNYYVAWLDMRHFPEYRIYGSRISPVGEPLDGRGVELLRTMSDERMDGWKKAPFAPGIKGAGWHRHLRQPAPPALSTNGGTHLLTSGHSSEFIAVQIDATTGEFEKTREILKFPEKLSGARLTTHWNRLRHTPTGKGFLAVTYQYAVAFGANGSGLWAVAELDHHGRPPHDNGGSFGHVVVDTDQRTPPGYRTYGLRSLSMDIAWDGMRALIVSEQYRHGSGRRALSATHTPGNIDILAMFVNDEGERLRKPLEDAGVEPDEFQRTGTSLVVTDGPRISPVEVAIGPSAQSNPAVAAGPPGRFLVVWQQETAETDSRIMARLVGLQRPSNKTE